MLLLLVLARKTLNQTLRQVKKGNVVATVDKHQEVKFSLYYNEEFHWPVGNGKSENENPEMGLELELRKVYKIHD